MSFSRKLRGGHLNVKMLLRKVLVQEAVARRRSAKKVFIKFLQNS